MTFNITTTPLDHQNTAVAKLLPSRVGGLLMDMGTGKSLSLLMLAKARQGKWDSLFWFTPCALRENVRRQIIEHTDITSICVWRDKALDNVPSALIHIIGIETISSSDRAILEYDRLVTDKSFVAVDESHFIKNPKSNRGSRLIALSARSRYRAILTGTPISQSIADLYGQFTFLSPKILGYRSWWSFANNHLVFEQRRDALGQKFTTGRVLDTHGSDYLADRIAPYVYQVRKDECLDLPDKMYKSHWCEMTEVQRDAYEQAKEDVLKMDYLEWSSVAIFHLFTTLQTITCGFWRKIDGSVVDVPNNRLKLLVEIVKQIDGPIVIWAKYRRAVDAISDELSKIYGVDRVHKYYGDQSEHERETSLSNWRASGGFFVATQSMGGSGLTLVDSSTAIFFASSFKYSERIQAEDRQHRIGQKDRPLYISIGCSNSIDERIGSALATKASIADNFASEINDCRSQGLKERAVRMIKAL